MKKFTLSYLLILFFFSIISFGQTESDSLMIAEQSIIDSLKLEASRDSLRIANQKTIEHVSKIFSKFKNKRPKMGSHPQARNCLVGSAVKRGVALSRPGDAVCEAGFCLSL